MPTIIEVSQSNHSVNLDGMTLDEVYAKEREVEAANEARAKREGWTRYPGRWLFVREVKSLGRPEWGHMQWHLDADGRAVRDGANWDSSG
jgi:hypothetical protein|tara:strand:+ start:370 stop:639 length:270 start_codon:yes stop_codon:yes gene_type:complete